MFADVAQNKQGEIHSQAWSMIAIANADLAQGGEAPLNITSARSGKIDRVCASSLAIEPYAMVGAVACAEWVQAAYCDMVNSLWDPSSASRRLAVWDDTTPEAPSRLITRGALAFRCTADAKLRSGLAISDAKSLYDALEREARGKEPRVALAVGEIRGKIKQGMVAVGLAPRWIPHNTMIVDGMTKYIGKSNLQPLLKASEKDEEPYRRELKEAGKTVTCQRGRSVT